MSEAELLETMVERLLVEGVPTGVIARAFELDIDLVKERQAKVRRNKYGTDDLSEYMEQMQWTAVDEALKTMTAGSVSEKTRFVSAILGKQMAVAARRTPESQRKAVDSLMDMLSGMRSGPAKAPAKRSRFVAVMNGGNGAESGPGPEPEDIDPEADL
jgi:hypothetical protein